MIKTVIVKDIKGIPVCYFSQVKNVENIAYDYFFKVVLKNGKFFIFDTSSYSYEIVVGKKVKIVNGL